MNKIAATHGVNINKNALPYGKAAITKPLPPQTGVNSEIKSVYNTPVMFTGVWGLFEKKDSTLDEKIEKSLKELGFKKNKDGYALRGDNFEDYVANMAKSYNTDANKIKHTVLESGFKDTYELSKEELCTMKKLLSLKDVPQDKVFDRMADFVPVVKKMSFVDLHTKALSKVLSEGDEKGHVIMN